MNKIISFWILIGGLFLLGGFIIAEFVLAPGFVQEKPKNELTPSQTQPASQKMPKTLSFGIYEACSDIADCDIESGIKKIKDAGAESVIITVVDEDDLKSVAYYPSRYLPMADYVSDNYLERVIDLAHKNKIKVYASINMPYNYWLARHPDWISVLSNGESADKYEQGYDSRTVPPSRVIAEKECKELLKNIIEEVISYGVDGIDINDNFQFSAQYLEESGTMLYSSFDDFTIKKFEEERNLTIQGNSSKEWAEYIESRPALYESWLSWRAGEINQLFHILKQNIKDAGGNIPLSPHLITTEDPYSYYGIDYKGIAKEVDVLYLMFIPEEEKERYFETIKNLKSDSTKKVAASTYLFKEDDWEAVEKDEEKISERIKWLKEAGADEIYFYNFKFIEEGNHWLFLKNIFEKI